MWIHLHFGDNGLCRYFNKIAKSLKHLGFFIFEPYEWHSYKKRKNMSEKFKMNIKNIKFRPHLYNSYLLNELGFKLVETINPIN